MICRSVSIQSAISQHWRGISTDGVGNIILNGVKDGLSTKGKQEMKRNEL